MTTAVPLEKIKDARKREKIRLERERKQAKLEKLIRERGDIAAFLKREKMSDLDLIGALPEVGFYFARKYVEDEKQGIRQYLEHRGYETDLLGRFQFSG